MKCRKPIEVIHTNPDNFNAQYVVFANSVPGTHLVLEDGLYVRPRTNKVVNGTAKDPMVIRAKNPLGAMIVSDEDLKHTLFRLEAGSSHVQYRDLHFGTAFFHVIVTSKIEGTSHHVLFADCEF